MSSKNSLDRFHYDLSFSIVIETENLAMAGLEDLENCLSSMKNQTLSLDHAKEVLVIAGSHFPREAEGSLRIHFPWIKVYRSEHDLSYTEAKITGALNATSEIVVFADSDVRYEKTWLENLLNVFSAHPDAFIAAGDTRLKGDNAYCMSLNLVWMLAPKPQLERAELTDDFRLNNFAAQRLKMLQVPFPQNYPLYRGSVPVWRERVVKKGFLIYRAPGTRSYHAPPETFVNWAYRMLIFGRDFVAKADFSFNESEETIERRNLPGRMVNLLFWPLIRVKRFTKGCSILLREDAGNWKKIFFSLPYCLGAVTLSTLGATIAFFNRDFLYAKINSLEGKRVTS